MTICDLKGLHQSVTYPLVASPLIEEQ